MNRFGAFSIHLGISLGIFAALAAVVVLVWYPDFFFTTDGGWQGIRLIAMVDVVLGPLLTLIVFDRRKPELKRDLTIIGVVQAACLVAGVYVVYTERPLALVYVDGKFYSMSAHSYTDIGLQVPDFGRFPGPYPKRLIARLPADPEEQSRIRRDAYAHRVPLRARAQLYEAWNYQDLNASREAAALADLKRLDQHQAALTNWLARHGGTLDDYAFFPYGARYDYTFLAVSRKTRAIDGKLNLSLVRQPMVADSASDERQTLSGN